jgi:hypothetical protein
MMAARPPIPGAGIYARACGVTPPSSKAVRCFDREAACWGTGVPVGGTRHHELGGHLDMAGHSLLSTAAKRRQTTRGSPVLTLWRWRAPKPQSTGELVVSGSKT